MKTIILFFAVLLSPVFSFASEYSTECFKFEKPLYGGYCIHRPLDKSRASGDILYHFHGLLGTEKYWSSDFYYPEQLREVWEKTGAKIPVVISVSFGGIYLLAEKNESAKSGLFERFRSEILPEIEKSLGMPVGRRLLVGESMGGFNSVQLALKTNLFQKAALLCVPIYNGLTPFSPEGEIQKYIERTAVWKYYSQMAPETVQSSVKDTVFISKMYFPNELAWKKSDPMELAKTVDIASLPSLYVAVGKVDKYAIYESNKTFVDTLMARGATIEWRPQFGGHCSIDIPSLARFLSQPDRKNGKLK